MKEKIIYNHPIYEFKNSSARKKWTGHILEVNNINVDNTVISVTNHDRTLSER